MDTNTSAISQVEAIKALTHELPLNDFGLPIGIYRVDLLPFHNYISPGALLGSAAPSPASSTNGEELPETELAVPCETPMDGGSEPHTTHLPALAPESNGYDSENYRIAGFLAKSLNQAFVPLQYDEGFPAFTDGRPFWGRLECEPQDVFYAFDQYLKMPLGRTADLEDDEDFGETATGTRSLSDLVAKLYPELGDTEFLRTIEQYREYFYLYYWGMRAHAYDLFRVAQHQKQQELRAIETQDEHYVNARQIRHRLMRYITSEDEFWDLMTPKVATDLLKQTTMLERVSAGVPAMGPPAAAIDGDGSRGRPFEVAFRSIAQSNRPQVRASIEEDSEVLASALDDPETTKVLQEIIIRSGG